MSPLTLACFVRDENHFSKCGVSICFSFGLTFNINSNVNFCIAQTATVGPMAHYLVFLYHDFVLFGAVCTIEMKGFQSSAKSRWQFCSFQFSRQLLPRSLTGQKWDERRTDKETDRHTNVGMDGRLRSTLWPQHGGLHNKHNIYIVFYNK